MLRFIVRRLLWAAFLFFVVTFVTYLIFYVTPADPARLVAGQGASPAEVQRVAERLHLNDPMWKQYGYFIKKLVVEQSLGESFKTRQDVNDIIAPGGARDRLARVRRRDLLVDVVDPDRDPVRVTAPLAARPGGDDVRADRDRGAPGLDRPDPSLLHQLQARAGRRSGTTATSSTPAWAPNAAAPCNGPTT